MFLFKNARCQRFFSIVGDHRYGSLRDDRPAVERLVNKVDGATTRLNACIERLPVRVEARKGGSKLG